MEKSIFLILVGFVVGGALAGADETPEFVYKNGSFTAAHEDRCAIKIEEPSSGAQPSFAKETDPEEGDMELRADAPVIDIAKQTEEGKFNIPLAGTHPRLYKEKSGTAYFDCGDGQKYWILNVLGADKTADVVAQIGVSNADSSLLDRAVGAKDSKSVRTGFSPRPAAMVPTGGGTAAAQPVGIRRGGGGGGGGHNPPPQNQNALNSPASDAKANGGTGKGNHGLGHGTGMMGAGGGGGLPHGDSGSTSDKGTNSSGETSSDTSPKSSSSRAASEYGGGGYGYEGGYYGGYGYEAEPPKTPTPANFNFTPVKETETKSAGCVPAGNDAKAKMLGKLKQGLQKCAVVAGPPLPPPPTTAALVKPAPAKIAKRASLKKVIPPAAPPRKVTHTKRRLS